MRRRGAGPPTIVRRPRTALRHARRGPGRGAHGLPPAFSRLSVAPGWALERYKSTCVKVGGPMKPVMRWWPIGLVIVVVTGAGCSKATSTMRSLAGLDPKDDPSVTLKSAETRWLLIKNPRFGDVPSEPEYIWVEEDKVPLTMKTFVLGKGSIIAPPEIV